MQTRAGGGGGWGAEQVKVTAAKLDDLSSVLMTRKVEGENWLPTSRPPTSTSALWHVHGHTDVINRLFSNTSKTHSRWETSQTLPHLSLPSVHEISQEALGRSTEVHRGIASLSAELLPKFPRVGGVKRDSRQRLGLLPT